MSRRRAEPHTLAGAHVMDALDAPDQRRFARHLRRCLECGDEVSGLREVTGRLAAASAELPPAALKERVLVMAERTRQLPPAIPRHRGWRAGLLRAAWSGIARPGAHLPRLAIALAGALAVAVAAIWLAGWPFGPAAGLGPFGPAAGLGPSQPGPARPPPPAIAAVLTAPDAVMVDATVRTRGTATVVMSLRERELVFAAAGLSALPGGRCYELWLMDHGRDRPAGLLPLPRHGMTGPVIATGLHPGDRLGLSVEPATGSGHPTGAMLMVLAL